MQWAEWIGYAGSVLIAVSLMMNNIWKLRWVNFTGAVVFTAYGLIVRVYPVVLLNSFIAAADAFYLIQMARQRDYFSLLPLRPQSVFREKFLEFYRADIARHFPDFDWAKLREPQSVFVLRNLMPVGLFVYELQPDGIVEIRLDYVVPHYRDLKTANFIFSAKHEGLREKGFHTFVAHSGVERHQDYLRKIGFRQDPTDASLFRKLI
jgi:hypothetical protein